jgi:hypothetical protein
MYNNFLSENRAVYVEDFFRAERGTGDNIAHVHYMIDT